MLRGLLNKLSGTHITIMAVTAMLVPGAVTAAVTAQQVAITDPATGRRTLVDSERRLAVYDSVADYRNWPANFVDIAVSNSGSACETSQYAVPSGKALVITAISGYEAGLSSTSYTGFLVFDGANCSNQVLTQHYSDVAAAGSYTYTPLDLNFGVGFVLKAGRTLSVYSNNNSGYTYFHGYLVPAAAAPTLASADAAAEPRPITAAQVFAKMKKLQQR